MHPDRSHIARQNRRFFAPGPAVAGLVACVLLTTASPRASGVEHEETPVPQGWFVFAPANTSDAGAIGMADWLEAPAGRHGFATMQDERLVFADGTPVKFWGVNHPGITVAPERTEADARAAWLAKYGINAVRFHKFTWHENGMGAAERSTELDPALLDRLDYFTSRLKTRGIYHAWSHIWGQRPRPGDRSRILAYDEIVTGPRTGPLDSSTEGIVNLFDDLQALNIELTVNMLSHVNPYTGLRYADDPALIMIELQNEDNVWWATGDKLRSMPTYRARLAALFCDWLRGIYGSEEKLLAAWGPQGLDLWPEQQAGESLARNNIYPPPDRRYYQPEALAESPSRQRLLDCARFLHERQELFYARFTQAIRAAGYRGVLIGSGWIADSGLPHFYNLLADYNVGMIDRHTYYGGGSHFMRDGTRVRPTDSMIRRRNLGLLGIGLLQVSGRPFGVSEWNSKPPNQWVAEGPPLIAFYGMGLQGWDASYQFTGGSTGFSPTLEGPMNMRVYNVNTPAQLGLYPALARSVYRGDVREGEPVLPRRQVSLADLHRGTIGFPEQARHEAEFNELLGAVPVEALAVGKVQLEFVPDSQPLRAAPDISSWQSGPLTRSNTGELIHDQTAGWFTVDTQGTKAVVGSAGGTDHPLGAVMIRPATAFAAIVLTDAERAGDLERTRRALLGVMARTRNSGQRYNKDGTVLEAAGTAPIILEGVQLVVEWPRLGTATVEVLDHDGRRTGRRLHATPGGRLELDGAHEQAFLFEITWP